MSSRNDLNVPLKYGTLVRDDIHIAEDDDEDEEFNEDGVPWFYVNQSGFPIDSFTWDRMWNHIAKIHPEGLKAVAKIRDSTELPEKSFPQAPVGFTPSTSIWDRLEAVQNYMKELEYNHTGTQFFAIRKNRPLTGLMDTAKEMIKESLPIKCLEAVILGIYLTNGFLGVDRFPISFKSTFNGNTFRHVVLGVYYNGKYGALGMSRRSDLMDKPITFRNLSHLVSDYETAYKRYWHDLKKVVIGTIIPHEAHSYESIGWRYLILKLNKISTEEKKNELDKYAREMRNQPFKSTIPVDQLMSPKKVTSSPVHKKISNTKSHSRVKGTRRSSKSKAKSKNNRKDCVEEESVDTEDLGEESDTQEESQAIFSKEKVDSSLNYNIRI